jgi:integrase
MARIEAPKRLAADDLDVTTVTGADVRRLFDACETLHELVCLSTLAYLGPRRRAASALRWRDVDLERERIRFREKGGKVITKPIPREYAAILRAARAGERDGPAGYVIPMVRSERANATTESSTARSSGLVPAPGSRFTPTLSARPSRSSFWRRILASWRRFGGCSVTQSPRPPRSTFVDWTGSVRWRACRTSPGASGSVH